MDKLNLNKKQFSKNQYERVIDTKFHQLANSTPINETQVDPSISIEEFFNQYNQLFFQIPKLGATNSHEYLIKRSSEYINFQPINNDIQALIEEINNLQSQNLELNQKLIELQMPKS